MGKGAETWEQCRQVGFDRKAWTETKSGVEDTEFA